jgi:hypothetical protein
MAIHSAMDKSRDSDSSRKGKGNIPLACPMSGRKAVLDQDHGFRNVSSEDEETEDDNDWNGKGDTLGVIPEDMETERWGQADNPLSDTSPRASLAGSMRSLRSVSQIGSVASGINVNIPAGSRQYLCRAPAAMPSSTPF